MLKVRVPSPKEAVQFTTGQKGGGWHAENELSFSSASHKTAVKRKPRRRRRVKMEVISRFESIEDDQRTEPGCRKPNIGTSFAWRVENSSDFNSPDAIGAREIYSSESVSAAVIAVPRLTKRREEGTSKRNKYSRTRFSRYTDAQHIVDVPGMLD